MEINCIDRKTLKINYSCTKNIFQIINNHNKNMTKDFQDQINNNNNNNNNCVKKECNCKSRDNCSMNRRCNLNNIIHEAIIYPKENITDKKKLISVYLPRNGRRDMQTTNILSPTNTLKITRHYQSNSGS